MEDQAEPENQFSFEMHYPAATRAPEAQRAQLMVELVTTLQDMQIAAILQAFSEQHGLSVQALESRPRAALARPAICPFNRY